MKICDSRQKENWKHAERKKSRAENTMKINNLFSFIFFSRKSKQEKRKCLVRVCNDFCLPLPVFQCQHKDTFSALWTMRASTTAPKESKTKKRTTFTCLYRQNKIRKIFKQDVVVRSDASYKTAFKHSGRLFARSERFEICTIRIFNEVKSDKFLELKLVREEKRKVLWRNILVRKWYNYPAVVKQKIIIKTNES